ncbi:HAD hydrolase family protein [Mycoplasma elephantis]|uniref:HAD hydrolase family protein n=1 Tax=Mycoplasma elephantis TaxID=114882 RepID=UPI000A5DF4DB|nr:HAD hydrolase family protein [Mycoplasma elephantis]
MNKNIIFIDLDGTTLNDKKGKKLFVSKNNIDSIKEAKKYFNFIVSTGRPYHGLTLKILQALEINDIIFWNGASAFIDNKKIIDQPMSIDDGNKFIKYAKENNLNIIFDSNRNQTYSKNKLLRLINIFSKKIPIKDTNKLENNKTFYKALVFGHSQKKLKQVWNFANSLPNTICVFSGKRSHYVEITNKNATKGIAEVKVANYYNVDPKKCIHIGDTMNDATCKNLVGKLIAVANASPEFKNIADITYDVCAKDDAIKHIISDLINKKLY